jgi:hypothetical protein
MSMLPIRLRDAPDVEALNKSGPIVAIPELAWYPG